MPFSLAAEMELLSGADMLVGNMGSHVTRMIYNKMVASSSTSQLPPWISVDGYGQFCSALKTPRCTTSQQPSLQVCVAISLRSARKSRFTSDLELFGSAYISMASAQEATNGSSILDNISFPKALLTPTRFYGRDFGRGCTWVHEASFESN